MARHNHPPMLCRPVCPPAHLLSHCWLLPTESQPWLMLHQPSSPPGVGLIQTRLAWVMQRVGSMQPQVGSTQPWIACFLLFLFFWSRSESTNKKVNKIERTATKKLPLPLFWFFSFFSLLSLWLPSSHSLREVSKISMLGSVESLHSWDKPCTSGESLHICNKPSNSGLWAASSCSGMEFKARVTSFSSLKNTPGISACSSVAASTALNQVCYCINRSKSIKKFLRSHDLPMVNSFPLDTAAQYYASATVNDFIIRTFFFSASSIPLTAATATPFCLCSPKINQLPSPSQSDILTSFVPMHSHPPLIEVQYTICCIDSHPSFPSHTRDHPQLASQNQRLIDSQVLKYISTQLGCFIMLAKRSWKKLNHLIFGSHSILSGRVIFCKQTKKADLRIACANKMIPNCLAITDMGSYILMLNFTGRLQNKKAPKNLLF
ncbi:hypothetical protein VP01_2704g2 [Puccinia sorghi]|uniref:Uncharacterized protein n=1 Tax=Puccinia sorghi TaxID=27349 RepID=A0A0L6V5F0_9BASI|nr:hypothetical protein VP01_2704g2 [Puccinia sorghi]